MRTLCRVMVLLALPALSLAGPAGNPVSQAFQPIETHMGLGLFGILGGSMEYRLNGKRITEDEDFKKLIYPLKDEEASQLIRDTQSNHFAANVFYVTGALCGLDVAVFYKPPIFIGVDWIDRIAIGVVVAQIFTDIGSLFDANADARKYNAVQIYNRKIRKQDEAFLGIQPQVSLASYGPSLGLLKAF